MNKMTKGAIATGIGVALLLGGGGTLALWNVDKKIAPGAVIAGDLNLAAGAGVWTNAENRTITLSDYRAVPGDVLTFTQPVTVALEGDLMKATLSVTDDLVDEASYLDVSTPGLKRKSDNSAVPTELTSSSSGEYVATVTVTFDEGTSGRVGALSTNALGSMAFTLEQTGPSAS